MKSGITVFFHALVLIVSVRGNELHAQEKLKSTSPGIGWARNSVNAVVFRRNSLITYNGAQFTAFYDQDQYVVLAKRKINSDKWITKRTFYKGRAEDAHNSISLSVDGHGFLHLAWDHHNSPLRYCRSIIPGSLELTTELAMTGTHEDLVTYPEFHKLNNGDLLFLYRKGESGEGNLVMKYYNTAAKQWSTIQENLIDGEGERNAYWQSWVDNQNTIHLSWVWRETWDVATNHDLCYARSPDGGKTWFNSAGEKYTLPITAKTAEYACKIPQKSELINQTSMTTDAGGTPFIATYWRDQGSDIPQYHIVYRSAGGWQTITTDFRKEPFSLSGGGTKRIPISRPQILVSGTGNTVAALLIFRDAGRGSRVSSAIIDIKSGHGEVTDLTMQSVGSWEPTYDTELWKQNGKVHLFVQHVEQADAEGKTETEPQPVYILEWTPDL